MSYYLISIGSIGVDEYKITSITLQNGGILNIYDFGRFAIQYSFTAVKLD